MAKEVIIFGDGPSIRNYDLLSINPNLDRIYCGNQIFNKNFNANTNGNSHYIVIEPRLLWPNFMLDKKRKFVKSFKTITNKMIDKFKINNNINFYLHWTNIPFIYNLSNLTFICNKRVPFTTYLEHISGSFQACISLANHLGYNKIHLLGFDSFVLKESSYSRWYEKIEKIITNDASKAVQFIINKYDHINFNVVSEPKLILDSNKLFKSDLKIKYSKNRIHLSDLIDEDDIRTLSSSKHLNIDI